MSHPMKLDALAARALAEYASGIRGEDGSTEYLVTTRKGRSFSIQKKQAQSPCSTPEEVVTPIATAYVQPARPKVLDVSIRTGNMVDPESLMRYDAVFWSEAAVEKFVFPYYASKQQWQAAHTLSKLAKQWYGFVPEPTNEPWVTEGGAGGAEADNGARAAHEGPVQEDEAIPFAVGHLPRSDYVTLADDMVLLFRTPDGQVLHRPLSEFL